MTRTLLLSSETTSFGSYVVVLQHICYCLADSLSSGQGSGKIVGCGYECDMGKALHSIAESFPR